MGKPTGQLDALIASVAQSGQNILVSDNTPYFINIANFKLDNCLRTNS
jgi:tRNA(fMet)-specific endonuclease VapC